MLLQLAGKDREIEYLKKDIVEIRRKYEEIYGTKLEDLAEVKVYSGLIMPEIQRMSKYALVKHDKFILSSCFRATDKRKHRSKSRTRKSSSSSDDEQKVRQHSTAPILNYQMNYEQASQTLVLTIIKCLNLKKADLMGGKPDPMVSIFLKPGHQKPAKTKVVKNEQNPIFNETFRFQVKLISETKSNINCV